MINNSTLKIGLLQTDIAWEDKKANLSALEKAFSEIGKDKFDIIVLPEMFNSGFSLNTQLLSESMEGETIQLLKLLAKEKNTAIVGSLIIEEEEKYFNRLVFIEPSGTVFSYDKKHLFSLVGEEKKLKSGNKQLRVEYKDWNISFYICYDLRFPVWCNNSGDIDLMIFVANWPAKRIHHWDVLLRARAIENQCYVAATNRVGNDGHDNQHNGHSAIFDYTGKQLTPICEEVKLIKQTIEKDVLINHRLKYPFLKDNDVYNIKDI